MPAGATGFPPFLPAGFHFLEMYGFRYPATDQAVTDFRSFLSALSCHRAKITHSRHAPKAKCQKANRRIYYATNIFIRQ